MNYHYNLTRLERREFVEAISQILDAPVIHYDAPANEYRIDLYRVDRNNILSYSKGADPDEVQFLISRLWELGYVPLDKTDGTVSYIAAVPLGDFSRRAFRNLQEIIAHKGDLLKRAFGAKELPIMLLEDQLWFPWFTLYGFENEVETYNYLAETLCEIAKKPDSTVKQLCSAKTGYLSTLWFLLVLGLTGKRHEAAHDLLVWNFADYIR